MSSEKPTSKPFDQDFVPRPLSDQIQEEVRGIMEDLRGGNQTKAQERLSDLRLYITTLRDKSLRDAGGAEGTAKDDLLSLVGEAEHALAEIAPLESEVAGT